MLENLLNICHELNRLKLTYKIIGDEDEILVIINTIKNEYSIKVSSYDYSLYTNGKHTDTSKTIDRIIKLI